MRPLLLLAALLLVPVLHAQPIDPPRLIPAPEPSIGHLYARSGRPSAPLYYLTDTILVRVTGHVKLDGGCGSGTPMYGFQRKEGDAWTNYLSPGTIQDCCGMPSAEWFQHTVALIPAHVEQHAYGKPWKPGEYRVVIALVGEQFVVGPSFRVVAEE